MKNLRNLAFVTTLALFGLWLSGGIVRASGGAACPDWPTCFGALTPPASTAALPDYVHRLAALVVTALAAATAIVARRQPDRRLRRLTAAALALIAAQSAVGLLVRAEAGPGGALLSAQLHLLLTLLALAALSAVSVLAAVRAADSAASLRLSWRSPYGRLAWASAFGLLALFVSGSIVASLPASACAWPLCRPTDLATTVALGHRLLVAAVALLMALTLRSAWRTQRTQTAVITAATAAGVLFFAQALLGAQLANGLPASLRVVHTATAAASWVAVAVLLTFLGLAQRSAAVEAAETLVWRERTGLGRDLLALTKPIVVALLLVTTYAGMVIGAQAWPSLGLTFWTLLGGFMAAGGSGAINQYIDRSDDGKMQRTQKRPIPAGRLNAGEGLAFGVGMTVASFYLVLAFVNLLAALLTLAGIIYYVLLYSVFLKKTTVQNIVIGGGAGAIPPLVGWAAATGALNVPSLFLFAVVFMWTPPHFWALALVRRKDYARAGVPMLPVIRGEVETRKQILIYTIELVGLTLLLPLFGLGGSIYLVGAVALGGWLLHAAWKVWKDGGNKLAWKMYRYSSMYLAFLFVVLMVDRLL
jgi:protoheme IX farnesyltransferase